MMRALMLGAALALAGSGAVLANTSLTDVDRAMPAFELDGLDGETWNTEALDGRPWVVNFWATWCAPCVEELPAMNAAWALLEDDGVGMLAINAGEGEEAIREFLDKVPVDFPIALGDGATSLQNWSIKALPTTLVVNVDGQVVYEALGPRDWDDEGLLDRVRALLD